MFGAIFIVFGLFLFLLLNRGGSHGASGGGNVTVQNSGPSDAAIQAGLQIQGAQINANANIVGAQIGASTSIELARLSLSDHAMTVNAERDATAATIGYHMAELAASHDLAGRQLDASLTALSENLFAQTSMAHDNNQFMLDYARNAQDAATNQVAIGAHLQEVLGAQTADVTKALSADQTKAFEFGSLMSASGRLKKGKLERFLTNVSNNTFGDPANNAPQPSTPSSGGGFHIPVFGAVGGFLGI